MRNIYSITLFFENTDCLTIDSADIGNIRIANIHEVVQRAGVNSIASYKQADSFEIEIFNSANELMDDSDKYVFERLLEWNDIVLVSVNYDCLNPDKSEDIYLPWKDKTRDGAENLYQSIELLDDKIVIRISENGDCG